MGRLRSINALLVLATLAREQRTSWYGLALAQRIGAKSGTIYPLLRQLEADGLIIGDDEAIDPRDVGRPMRRTYELTDLGREIATDEVARVLLLL